MGLRCRKVMVALCLCLSAVSANASFETIKIERTVLPTYRLTDGTIEAINESVVSAQISGEVTGIYVDVNDFVEKGATILEIDATSQKNAVTKMEGEVLEARARTQEAQLQFQRAKELVAQKSISQASYEKSVAAFEASKARYQKAQAAYNEARIQLSYAQVKAPYAGVVKARHVQLGEKVRPGTPLMTGLSLEKLRVILHVSQNEVAPIRQSKGLEIELPDGRVIATKPPIVFPFAETKARTFQVRAEVSEATSLYPGVFVKVRLPQKTHERIWIPASALVKRSELTAVYVINKSGGLRLRSVRTGKLEGGQVEILAGLEEGEFIAKDALDALSKHRANKVLGNE